MFTEKDLQELLNFAPERPVLSLYLNTYLDGGNSEVTRLRLRNMLKTIDLPEDIKVVEQFTNLEFDWKGQSLAIFSCEEADFLRTFPLSLEVSEQIQVAKRPVLTPLIGFMETYGHWGIVLVDQQGARVFSCHLGELEEVEGFMGEEIKQTKRGGGDSFHGRMGGSTSSANVAASIDRNISESTEHAVAFFKAREIRRIMIGGTDENITRFSESLPKAWQSLIAATFPLSMTGSYSEILTQALSVIKQTAQDLQVRLVDQAITAAAKGSNGALGIDDILNAIHTGSVQNLLVLENYSEPGIRCMGCGFMTTQSLESCPFCGGVFSTIDDAVETSVREARQKNASVIVIPENEALKEAGGIAAILRY